MAGGKEDELMAHCARSQKCCPSLILRMMPSSVLPGIWV